jgi:hypothetical protein
MKRGACLLIAVFTIAAGCGGSGDGRLSKSEYQATLRSAFSSASDGIRALPHSAGSAALLERIAKSYGEIASALKGLRVPANVQRLNDHLVVAASAKAAGLKKLVSKLDSASPAERQRLLAGYDPKPTDFDSVVDALEAKGYRFRPNAGT